MASLSQKSFKFSDSDGHKLEKEWMRVPVNFKVWLVLLWLLVAARPSAEAEELLPCPNDCGEHQIHIATGQEGGMYYKLGQFLTQSLRKDPSFLEAEPNSLGFIPTNGAIDNLRGVDKGDYSFGIVQSDVLRYWRDPNSHDSNRLSQVVGVGAIYREPVYILVRNKLYLSGIHGLRGKKVAIGPKDSGTRFTSEVILGMFGITLDELEPQYLKYEETATAFRKQTIDAAIVVIANLPSQLEKLIDEFVYILKMDRSDLTKIASARPYLYHLIDVPDPTTKKEFTTISVTSVLIADPNTKDGETVHIFAELLWKLCKGRNKPGKETDEYKQFYAKDPNFARLLVDYPFVLYGERNNPDRFHKAAYTYYEDPNLIRTYKKDKRKQYALPVGLLLPLLVFIVPLLIRKPRLIALHKWARWMQASVPACGILCFFLAVSISLYIGICSFELGVENPDITGSPKDLLNMFLFVSKLGEIFCVTTGGRVLRRLASLVGPAFGISMLLKISGPWLLEKIREALKMIPDKSFKHVVICNWTTKTRTIVEELRSPVVKWKRIIIIARSTQEPPDQSELPKDVWILPGNPAGEDILRGKKANILEADTVLILADDKESGEPDARSVLILHSVKNVLEGQGKQAELEANKVQSDYENTTDNIQEAQSEDEKMRKGGQRPNIIVEVTKPDFEGPIREQGADETVPSAEITAKLLARAVGMRKVRVIEFIRKILTSERVSNEVYGLEIGDEIRSKTLENCRKRTGKGECTFSDFAYEMAERYKKKYKGPITIVGVRSEGKDYINPKDKKFLEIKETINAAIVIAWEQPKNL